MTGEELDKIRKKLGWSKKQLQSKLGIRNYGTILNYIKSKKVPGPVKILMLYYEKHCIEEV